jgi:hypothetical protein
VSDLFSDASLAIIECQVDEWLAKMKSEDEVILAIDHGDPDPAYRARWYVRMKGDTKDFITVWLTLGQRTLRYETYVMPAPDENYAEFYEHLLRRNRKTTGMAFCIGEEEAIFLAGSLPVHAVDEGELDRILGSLYMYVEQFFQPALRIGFATRFSNN